MLTIDRQRQEEWKPLNCTLDWDDLCWIKRGMQQIGFEIRYISINEPAMSHEMIKTHLYDLDVLVGSDEVKYKFAQDCFHHFYMKVLRG